MTGIHTDVKPLSLHCTFPPQPLGKISVHFSYSNKTEETLPAFFGYRQDAPAELKEIKIKQVV